LSAAQQLLYNKHGFRVDTRREASKQIISFPAVKITGTLPSLASSTPCHDPDSLVNSMRICDEKSSTSLIEEQFMSDTLPSISIGAIKEETADGTLGDDTINNDSILDIMNFPNDEDDTELGNFLLDAADWL